MKSTETESYSLSWEQAVNWLRSQPNNAELVKSCYYDDPILAAAERFYLGTEWSAIRKFLPKNRGIVLDVGAGRGISSYAFAKDGWETVALEPDDSNIVGIGAIARLSEESNLNIAIVHDRGESLPFESESFDVVHCRAVLHHAEDLRGLCREIGRVLKPGAMLIASREHVISKRQDLPAFLASHPLHRLYGGENAYLLKEYLYALETAGLMVERTLNPYQSDINLFPENTLSFKSLLAKKLKLPSARFVPGWAPGILGYFDRTPGRLFTFIGRKTRCHA